MKTSPSGPHGPAKGIVEPWRIASGHPGGWRVIKGHGFFKELNGPSGRLLLFRTPENAQRRADKLNRQETKSTP